MKQDSTAAPEFSRIYRLTQIRQQPLDIRIEADADERAALVRRFGLVSLERLEAALTLTADGEDVIADGRLIAAVEQACVATGEPLGVRLDEPLALRFAPEPEGPIGEGEESEMPDAADAEGRDVVHFEGAAIDVGEAVAETLLLSLDPYPRGPNADAYLREKGVVSEEEAGPFGALAGLRDKLSKG